MCGYVLCVALWPHVGLHQMHAVVHSGFKVLAFTLFQSRLGTQRPGVLAGAAQNIAHRRLRCSALLFLATYDVRSCAIYLVIVKRSRYFWNPDSLLFVMVCLHGIMSHLRTMQTASGAHDS
jgi:hypothetical protein